MRASPFSSVVPDAERDGDVVCRLELGNNDTRRDFMDVRDVVTAYGLLLQRGDPRQVYLAGTGRSHSIRELVDMVLYVEHILLLVWQLVGEGLLPGHEVLLG